MSTRKSGRNAAKAPVKYTSSASGSDFETSKPKKTSRTKTQVPAAKKRKSPPADSVAPPKRRRKDPETLAAEHTSKVQVQEEKAQKQEWKKNWGTWLEDNAIPDEARVLDGEVAEEDAVTQTECLKSYGLKAGELVTLRHAEKPGMYGNTTKSFVASEVRELAWRKYGMLAGMTAEADILQRGEELWKEEHKDDAEVLTQKKKKEQTPKQKWIAYIAEHAVSKDDGDDGKLADEPEIAITQTDCKSKYNLTPQDLACLPYFPKKNAAYGNTMKLFKESEARTLAFRKCAVLAGVEEDDELVLLKRGEELHGGE
ncbi:hypothetical protein P153DRAFT_394357 [Dothidotthia symphoricarpi CBS 119687]|uniref:XPA C-terminal domain-containing protein n=1 Tax=Dothidotthia symphoricarpi CBS 119687 TaxID=1392245 RepID=A0A6A6AM78_9PLEO|nr:uncharacterized protein P153DRAFT_394357 [Dothidotthia symphoricarpi CBS 119687]KAF2132195.1 hypothetical protein P153DRAFT_394357 [Dothidotthia symphoricarpi CBS 119687]